MCCLGIAWGYGFEGIKTLQPARESFNQPEETLAGQETMVASRAESKGWRARMHIENLGSALFGPNSSVPGLPIPFCPSYFIAHT